MDRASYFGSHPPRCIAGFNSRPTELPRVDFDGHISMTQLISGAPQGLTTPDARELINSVFALVCRCGRDRHYIHCYRWVNVDLNNTVETLSPIVLECAGVPDNDPVASHRRTRV